MVMLVGVTAMDFNVAVGVTGGGEDCDPQEYEVPAAMLHINNTNLRAVRPGRLSRGVSRNPIPVRVIFAGMSFTFGGLCGLQLSMDGGSKNMN